MTRIIEISALEVTSENGPMKHLRRLPLFYAISEDLGYGKLLKAKGFLLDKPISILSEKNKLIFRQDG